MESHLIKVFGNFFWILLIILITSSEVQWRVMSEAMIDSNAIESSYENEYPYFTKISPMDSNFTSFILSQSRNNFSDKTTRFSLDITSPQMFQSKTIAQIYAVFPGTVWCGVGNLAGNNEVLGYFAQTDSCCRTHDKCRLAIPSGSIMFGLQNTGYFTRSHCSCDERFYYCLKKANSIISNKIGYTYFNLLRPQCFRKDYPIVACWRWSQKRCNVYMLDQSNEREWQWFDNRDF